MGSDDLSDSKNVTTEPCLVNLLIMFLMSHYTRKTETKTYRKKWLLRLIRCGGTVGSQKFGEEE